MVDMIRNVIKSMNEQVNTLTTGIGLPQEVQLSMDRVIAANCRASRTSAGPSNSNSFQHYEYLGSFTLDDPTIVWIVPVTHSQRVMCNEIMRQMGQRCRTLLILLRHVVHNTSRVIDYDRRLWRYKTDFHITVFAMEESGHWMQGDIFIMYLPDSWRFMEDYERMDEGGKGIELWDYEQTPTSLRPLLEGGERLDSLMDDGREMWPADGQSNRRLYQNRTEMLVPRLCNIIPNQAHEPVRIRRSRYHQGPLTAIPEEDRPVGAYLNPTEGGTQEESGPSSLSNTESLTAKSEDSVEEIPQVWGNANDLAESSLDSEQTDVGSSRHEGARDRGRDRNKNERRGESERRDSRRYQIGQRVPSSRALPIIDSDGFTLVLRNTR